MTLSPAEVAERSERVAPRLREHLPLTPFVGFGAFSAELGAEVLVKCEHLQRTGSFKARGAMAKILTLTDSERSRGVVTASTGNHGLGVGNALATLGGHGIVYLPENASPSKVAALRRHGLELRAEGNDSGVLEPKARAYAAEHDLVYVPPYNDPDVIAGQGTVGVEILEQLAGSRL
ncbi:MAG TPA: pyridoxal-phosphate dependent enzyme, partial [Jatrophihabitantaceae bacterium]|nr:pyridoxal-phosphate dependent enzyme [Jatrophihabitantaceae bacterium]